MRHLTDIELLDLISGRMAADPAHRAEEHVAACGSCARKHEDLAHVWDELETWQPSLPPRGLKARVLAAAHATELRPMRAITPSSVLRLAAAVLLAILAGGAAGRMAHRSQPPPASTPGSLHDALYLSMLTEESPSGFLPGIANGLSTGKGDEL